MPSSFPSSSPYISGVLLSSQTQKQGERERERETERETEREREGIGKKCRFQFLRHKISKFQKRNNINPLLSLVVVKRVCSVCDETDGETKREREKETKLLKLKAGLCSILLFLDVQKPKAKLFGSHKCISLCCLFVWGVGVRIKKKTKKNTEEEEEEKKGRSFFFLKDVQNPKRTTHQKTVTSFFSSFFSSSSFRRHSFHRIFFEQTGLSFVWISLSLSLSLSLRRKRRARFLVVVLVVVLRALFLFVLLLKACDHIIGKTFFLSTT